MTYDKYLNDRVGGVSMEDFRETTAQIVSAYAEGNKLSASDLPGLIQAVYRTLANAGEPIIEAAPAPIQLTAAQIKKSVNPDYIVSFEDGKRYKTMKRHLGRRGLTPDQYRAKWGLPSSYPMVSATYSQARSVLAKNLGLGSKGGKASVKAKLARKAPAKKAT
jgi:predicted transcriptional regulator